MDYLFKGVDPKTKESLLEMIHIKSNSYLRDEVIVHEGDLCQSIKFVKKGLVIARNTYFDGHETILKMIGPKSSFGEALILSEKPFYKGDFISEANTVVETLTKADLNLLLENEVIRANYIRYLSDSLINLNNHIKVLNGKSIRSKLSIFFYYEYLKNQAETFTIPYNKTSLAKYINVERESLSRELSSMVKNKIIANMGFSYTILDLKKIEKEL